MPAGNTFELIGSTTLASASATGLEVTSISSAYDDLFVICEMLNSVGSGINMRFNTDTGSNYYVDKLKISGTGTNSRIATTRGSTAANICPDTVSLPTSGTYFPVFVMTVHNYKDTSVKKVFETLYGNALGEVDVCHGLWNSSSAITAIRVFCDANMQIGSKISVYGIARA
jgi:hypothetical protein